MMLEKMKTWETDIKEQVNIRNQKIQKTEKILTRARHRRQGELTISMSVYHFTTFAHKGSERGLSPRGWC